VERRDRRRQTALGPQRAHQAGPATALGPQRRAGPGPGSLRRLRALVTGGRSPSTFADSDEFIEGHSRGLDPRVIRKLRKGEFAVRRTSICTGSSRDEAKAALEAFLARSRQDGKRCVLVVHGRGLHSKRPGAGAQGSVESGGCTPPASPARARLLLGAPARRRHRRDVRAAAEGQRVKAVAADWVRAANVPAGRPSRGRSRRSGDGQPGREQAPSWIGSPFDDGYMYTYTTTRR